MDNIAHICLGLGKKKNVHDIYVFNISFYVLADVVIIFYFLQQHLEEAYA